VIDDQEVVTALRTRLLSLIVASTGTTSLAVTHAIVNSIPESSFTRTTGSFITDGFIRGMEVNPVGFTDPTPATLHSVSALVAKLTLPRTAEASAPGRSLTVGIPKLQSWENVELANLPDKRWYIDEDYIPGIPIQITLGPQGLLEYWPTYMLKLSGLSGYGNAALFVVANGILKLFPPNYAMSMPDGYALRVRSNPGPNRSQLLPDDAGRSQIVITIPLQKRSKLA
jgi:hypothetical protein